MKTFIIGLILVCTAEMSVGQSPPIQKISGEPLPGTMKLDWEGDIVEKLIAAADSFFLNETLQTVKRQESFWNRDITSVESYEKSLEANREILRKILGLVDSRVEYEAPEKIGNLNGTSPIFETGDYAVWAIRWPVFDDYTAEGLLVEPKNGTPTRIEIRIPDAGEIPEDFIQPLCAAEEKTIRTLIPTTVSRTLNEFSAPFPKSRKAVLTNREYLYRAAFEMGRHLIGYEIQQALALVDWLETDPKTKDIPLHIGGCRDGGMIALYAGALDTRIDSVTVSGYFDNRINSWKEPIDRNVFGRLERFGDAQLAAMVFPRTLEIIHFAGTPAPEVEIPRGKGGAIGKLVPPTLQNVETEAMLARSFVEPLAEKTGKKNWLTLRSNSVTRQTVETPSNWKTSAAQRERRMIDALDRHTQGVLQRSTLTRTLFQSKLDTSSLDAYEKSMKFYKDYFENEIIGKFDREFSPLNVRSRKAYGADDIDGYEIVMDLYPGMFVYGLLFLPKELKPDRKYPTIVVQHGRNTRIEQLIEGSEPKRLEGILTRLARKGYITFAPQHLYMLEDKHRQIQRKAYPLKKTCFALMLSMQRQVVRYLKTLPHVDMDRLAFYGHSYGGKSAMRLPPLVDEYGLVVTSGDFGRYDIKMASTFYPCSFVFTGEYEMFEFDLGNTFNYSDMAAMIAPRPFFIERGNFDAVGWDEEVGYEYGKVLHLYQAKLDIPDRLGMDWFKGPHRVNAVKSFEFLDRWLKPEYERLQTLSPSDQSTGSCSPNTLIRLPP